jgi:succinyl-diaminopimelate desuccinylase
VSSQTAIAEWLRDREEEMAQLLMRLVAVDTENPPGRGLEECAGVLAEAMASLKLAPEVLEVEDSQDGRTGSVVIGHWGTVPGSCISTGTSTSSRPSATTSFQPRRQNGRIVGRGTADMKGGLVSMLYAAAATHEDFAAARPFSVSVRACAAPSAPAATRRLSPRRSSAAAGRTTS